MRLESDPTIIYGITQGPPLGRGIRQSELRSPGRRPTTPIQIDGLPPTPIANPGRARWRRCSTRRKTDDLFFVADGTGGHVFASTYERARWRQRRPWRAVERQRAAALGRRSRGLSMSSRA
jgi:UPF0755 protein